MVQSSQKHQQKNHMNQANFEQTYKILETLMFVHITIKPSYIDYLYDDILLKKKDTTYKAKCHYYF